MKKEYYKPSIGLSASRLQAVTASAPTSIIIIGT
jgi:hypothetical protein